MAYYTDRVTRVIDGDTFERESDISTNIRLEDVYAPELDQPGGQRAKAYLESLIGNRWVNIEHQYYDRYGRSVSQVRRHSDGLNVNQAMIQYLK
ncbi:MAG: thermonuclease family protein [Candidatus Poribacteria bacterium]|nr:thermonuclease family protein [Candidatus Poribacteria bacterium]